MTRSKRIPLFAALVLPLLITACSRGGEQPLHQPEHPFDPAPLMAEMLKRLSADRFSFVVLGDSRAGTNFDAVLAQASKLKPDFALTTGDMVSRGARSKDDWIALERKAGPFMRSIPTWPAIGNHELMGGQEGFGLVTFLAFYGLPRAYYSFVCRNARFIALSWPLPVKRELDFLKAELEAGAGARQHIFVFLHMPFFTVGEKPPEEIPNRETEITRLFTHYGVRAVFSGHDHTYYRTRRGGVPYLISAGSGAEIYVLKREAEAQPGDVYYGLLTGPMRYVLRTAGEKAGTVRSERIFPKERHYLLYVEVDGKEVHARVVDHTGEEWERFSLTHLAEPSAPAEK